MTSKRSHRRSVTLIHDTGAREDDALSRFQWVLPAVLLVATFILLVSILEWYSPQLPVLIFVGLVLVPLSLVLKWKGQRASMLALMKAIGAVAIFGLPLLFWNAGVYRTLPLRLAGDLLPLQTLITASGDRSEAVATLACRRVFETTAGDREVEVRMRTILEYRPTVARRCLESIEEDFPTVALTVSRHLHRAWYEGWMSAELMTEDIGCAAADAYASTAAMHGREGFSELLMCSLGAANQEFATCCSQALSEYATPQDILEVEPASWNHEHKEALFLALAQAVDLPSGALLGTDPINDYLAWSPRDLFHWTTHLGCHLLDHHAQADSIALRLSNSIETQCGLEVDDPLYSFAALQFVRSTCEGALDVEPGRQVDVVQWCASARLATRESALMAARFTVSQALHTHLVSGLGASISAGDALRRGTRENVEAHREQLRSDLQEAQREQDFVSDVRSGAEALREMGAELFDSPL